MGGLQRYGDLSGLFNHVWFSRDFIVWALLVVFPCLFILFLLFSISGVQTSCEIYCFYRKKRESDAK